MLVHTASRNLVSCETSRQVQVFRFWMYSVSHFTANYRNKPTTYIQFIPCTVCMCVCTSTSVAPDRDGWWARPAATCPGSTTWRETKRAGRKQKVLKSHVPSCMYVLERWPTFILHPPERVPTPASMAAAVRDTPKPMSVNILRTVPSSAPDAITCAHVCMYLRHKVWRVL